VIWAIEPDPDCFRLLEKNVLQNQLSDIKLINCALSSENGPSKFFASEKKGGLNGSTQRIRGEGKDTVVETRGLSGLLQGAKPDLIKIDIEGDEVAVIRDLWNHDVLESINEFILEYHRHRSSIPLHEFLNYFSVKFTYQIVTDDVEGNIILHFDRHPGP
jgi:FkbM family methyltransferase